MASLLLVRPWHDGRTLAPQGTRASVWPGGPTEGTLRAGGSMYDALTEAEWDKVDRVWDLLDDSEVERARTETNDLLGLRPRHPDLLVLDAAVAIEEGDPDRALDALRGAERSADPALLFHLRALARFH